MALGWREKVPFDEAIERTVRWYTENKDWWPLEINARVV
jgi:dTDP-glucose 4,6-dehydratase